MCDPKDEGRDNLDFDLFSRTLFDDIPFLTKDQFTLIHIQSGEGKLSKLLAEFYPESLIIGIETKETSIKRAHANGGRFHEKNLFYRLVEPHFLKEYQTYDYALAVIGEGEYYKIDRLLSKVERLLKTDGSLLLYIYEINECPLYQKGCMLSQSKKWKGFFRDFDSVNSIKKREWLSALSKVGFMNCDYERESLNLSFLSYKECRNYIREYSEKYFFPYLPIICRDDFIEDLWKEMKLSIKVSDISWAIPLIKIEA